MKTDFRMWMMTALALMGAATLTACSSSLSPTNNSVATTSGTGNSTDSGITPKTRYDMANGCYALQSVAKSAYAVHDATGAYAANAAALAGGEAFYMKPSALGSYLFYAKNKTLLAVSGTNVGSAAAPSSATDWTVDTDAQGLFTVVSISAAKALVADSAGKLTLADAAGAGKAGQFSFVPSSGCTAYPEVSTDSIGETYKGQGVNQPVIGFAEVHTHMAMGHEMSDGGRVVGPSAGGAMYGQMFNRYGVVEALKDCKDWHGPNGTRDPEAAILDMTPGKTHDTQGWPTFIDWPAATSQLHQAMYYKWVERAYKAGLRILVSEGTNIEALCQVAQVYESTVNPAAASTIDCNDMNLGIGQVKYLFELEKYVDAQEGGPGKGWFRIAKNPTEARGFINEGKLAVVPGLEFANLFRCNVTFDPAGNETSGCTKESIDKQIDEVWALGVRELFPYHDVNSSLGGTGIFDGAALNAVGFLGTHQFWKTYDCPNGGEGDSYFYPAGAKMTTAIPGTGNDPISQAVIANLQGPLPVYKPDVRQCNARGTTDLGKYALQQLMKKKFIIDIDHAELSIKTDMINMAKAQTPTYPLISAHGGHGGITNAQAKDILALGGLIYPFKPNGKGHVAFMKQLKPLWDAARPGQPMAVGYGMDANGIANRAGPRGAGSKPVVYPFTLFQGPDWGPQYAAAGIKPITFKLQTQPESGKTWNIDEVGTAHYGMVADYVEEIRLEGGKDALDALYNSAEAYLQMWEKTVNR